MKTKKIIEPESATFDQASALYEEKKKITRSPEYTEARIKAQLRIQRAAQVAANDKHTKADAARETAILKLEDELFEHQSKVAGDAQPTLL